MIKKALYLAVISVALLGLLVSSSWADESKVEKKVEKKIEKKPDYVGAKKCKICHKDVHASWATTGHAKTWETLKPEEQKNEKCVKCHSTGVTAKGAFLEGVQCEGCHGAGSAYKKKKIMQDRELAIKNGMVMPDSTLCQSCHNAESPTFKGFDYNKYKGGEKGVHKMGVKKEKATKKKG